MSAVTAATLVLAIDLGKFRSMFCWYDSVSKQPTFRSVPTNPDEFRDELLRHPVVTVVVEACSPAGWVHDLCERFGDLLRLPAGSRLISGAVSPDTHMPRG